MISFTFLQNTKGAIWWSNIYRQTKRECVCMWKVVFKELMIVNDGLT
jgi:hypothetical protein